MKLTDGARVNPVCRMLLTGLTWVIAYRFRLHLSPKLEMPYEPSFDVTEVKEKAKASAAVSGIFLAFAAAFLVAVLGKDFEAAFKDLQYIGFGWNTHMFLRTGLPALAGTVLPFLALREERRISGAKWDAEKTNTNKDHLQRWRYWRLRLWIVLLLAGALFISYDRSRGEIGPALALSGVALIVFSLLLLILSVEFYDTAGGWQSSDNLAYHFHLASMASHCYLLGLSTAAVGVSLLFCLTHVRVGSWLTNVVVLALTAMTEIERELYRRRP